MKKLKIGLFGAGVRGRSLVPSFMLLGCEIVAVCDFRPECLQEIKKTVGEDVAYYDSFDAFIEHKMDAVILANYFHEHAPYAIRLMEKGIHIFSECISNGTMGEGVALARAWDKNPVVYMLAENYPQMIFNREIKRVCDEGTLGKLMYAEGEYNHPGSPGDVDFMKAYNYFPEHWRNYLPRTYYITHSLGPIMYATGATPKRVTAFSIYAPNFSDFPTASRNGDRAAVITTQNDDGSVFRITGCAAYGAHHNAYRVCGLNGQIENLRGMGNKVMLRYNAWSKPEDKETDNLYEPEWNDKDEQMIKTSGHGGGDFLTVRMFVECVSEGKQPPHPFNLYSAINMSSVGILAHRSMLEGGVPYDIPDFRTEEARKQYENDFLTPFVGQNGEKPTLPCCSSEEYAPTETQLELFKKEVMGIKD